MTHFPNVPRRHARRRIPYYRAPVRARPVLSWPVRCRRGTTALEYAFLAALIALIGLTAASAVGNRLSVLLYNTAAHLLSTPPKEEPPSPP